MYVFKEFAMAFILENTKLFAESLSNVKKKKKVYLENNNYQNQALNCV